MNHKKRLVDAEASPSIHALIHRSLVPPTALLWGRRGRGELEEESQLLLQDCR
jgi:hypothetical protein